MPRGCLRGRDAGVVGGQCSRRGPGRGQSHAPEVGMPHAAELLGLASDVSKGMFELLGEEEEKNARHERWEQGSGGQGAVGPAGRAQYVKA